MTESIMNNIKKKYENGSPEYFKDFAKYNYHTHTFRCMHASGTERQYIEKAIECGIKILGFSDHVPCPFKEPGRKSTIRMEMCEAYNYADVLSALRDEYKADIDIYLGFEAEYIPEFWEEQLSLFREINLDYLIMGQHFIHGAPGTPYTGMPTEEKAMLTEYVDSVIAGAQTGLFMYIAHPDLVNYQGDDSFYEAEMRRLCVSMKELGVPLEINNVGMAGCRHYPNDKFWKIAAEVSCEAMIGLDAHSISDMCNANAYKRCKNMAEMLGIKLITECDESRQLLERHRFK